MQQTVTVPVASVATVSVALAAGATIANTDANSSVWVSNSPDVAPGNGMRLGPNGSIQWTTNKGACYARVDTGVSNPVVLSVSDDVAGLNNPVDIGIAVATRLLAQGVPSVFQGETIVENNISIPSLGGNRYGYLNLDVSRFASIVFSINPATVGQVSATFHTLSGSNLGSFDFPITHAGTITFVMPVTGPLLDFVFAGASGNPNVHSIYGSNRAVNEPRVLNGYARRWGYRIQNQALAAQTKYVSPIPFISNGKPCTIRAVITGTGVGKIGYTGFDSTDTLVNVDMIDSATGVTGTDGKEIERDFILPPGRLEIYWYSAVAATYTVVYEIVQQST